MSKAKELNEKLKKIVESPQKLLDPDNFTDSEKDTYISMGYEFFDNSELNGLEKWFKSTFPTIEKLRENSSKEYGSLEYKSERFFLFKNLKFPRTISEYNKFQVLVGVSSTGRVVSFIIFAPEQIKNSPVESIVFSKTLTWRDNIIPESSFMPTYEMLMKFVYPIKKSIMSDRNYSESGEKSWDKFVELAFKQNKKVAVYSRKTGELTMIYSWKEYLSTKADYFNYTSIFKNYQYLVWNK